MRCIRRIRSLCRFGVLLASTLLAVSAADAFDVFLANGSSSNGSWQANNTWVPTGATSVVSQTEVLARLASGPVTIRATGSDTVYVNAPLAWSANALSLQAGGDIRFNTGMSLTGTAGLVLEWGQAGLDVDSDRGYFLGTGVKIDLAENTSFKTRRGSDGSLMNYRVITRLGTDYNGAYDPNGLQWSGTNAALGADIDATATPFWNDGKQFVPGYRANFAGLGHSIDGLAMRAYEQHIPDAAQRSTRGGLFTTVDYVQDLRLTNVNVDVQRGNLVGGVAGVLTGRMRNVHVTGQVAVTGSVQSIGGLVGHSWGRILDSSNAATVTAGDAREVGGLAGTLQALSGRTANIERSRNAGAVTGSAYVGGLAGHMTAANYLSGTKTRIVASHNTGTVSGTTFEQRIGGLAGASNKGEIVDSSSVATVTTDNSHGQYVGGLVGEAWGTVVWGSYSGGEVVGKWYVGGLVGSAIPLHKQYGEYVGSIERSFSAASVTHSGTQYATAVGGLAGEARGVKISQSFSTGPVSVKEGYDVGGLVGHLWPYFTGTATDQVCQGVAEERGTRVDNSYSVSAVTAFSGARIGGLIGRLDWTSDGGNRLCKARVVNSYATGALNWGWSTATDFGGLIGKKYASGADAVVKSFWDTGRTDISVSDGGEPQGNMGSWSFYYAMADFWDFSGIWHVNQTAARDVLPGLRVTRAQYPVDVRMTAETTYTGSPSVWNGITPTLTYSIGGTVIPNPGIRPALVDSAISIGSANPGWQAGTYTQPVSGVDSEQFTFTYSAGLTVKKAKLTVRVLPVNRTYDDTAFTPTASNVQITGFVGGENASVLQGTLSFSGSGVAARHVGGYSVTPGGLSAANYEITYVSGPVTINKRTVTLRPVAASKPYDGTVYSSQAPAIISGSMAGGDTITNLAQQYDAAGVGSHPLSISPEFVIQDGNGGHNYQVNVDPASVTGSITPTPLVIRANNASKPYDGNPYTGGNGVQYFGFVNGEDASVLQGTLTYGGSSQGATAIGTGYVIAPSGLTSTNYAVQFENGILTIANRALTVRAKDVTRVYDGTAWSGGNGVTYQGFMDGDDENTPGILSGTLAYGGDSQGAVNAGSYAITPSGLSSIKYDITFVPGTLTTTRAPLTIRADDKARDYNGHPFNEYTATITGLVNGETAADLSGTLTFRLRGCANCWVTSPVYSTIGGLTIVPGGLTSANYAINYVNGRLDLNRLPLTVTALNVTQTYNGQRLGDPGMAGVRIEGFLPSEGIEQQLQLNTAVNGGNPRVFEGALYNNQVSTQPGVGTYPIQVRLMVRTPPSTNSAPLTALIGYAITYVNGTFTVTPAPLTVTANDDTRPNGSAAYSGGNGVAYEGFVNGETAAVLGGAITYGGSSQGATAEGFYDIVPGGHTAANYAIDYIAGQLTIGSPTLTYNIAISASANGSIACNPNPVARGGTTACTATPSTGYAVGTWGDACAATPAGSSTCTLTNVQAPQTVSATFTQNLHAITVTPGINGNVVCAPNPVPHGGTTVCTATPSTGYAVGTWGDACSATPAGSSTCTLTNVQAPQTVSAQFSERPPGTFAITVTPGVGGSVACAPNPVAAGSDVTCTATPDDGHILTGWTGACAGTDPVRLVCTIVNVQAATIVGAQFAPIPSEAVIKPVPTMDRSMQALLGLLALGLGLMTLRARGR